MKSKACTRCRQWKVRCDADECSQLGCTRCRSLKADCVVDTSFKRVSTTKRWQQMQSELTQLRKAQDSWQAERNKQLPTDLPSNNLSFTEPQDPRSHQDPLSPPAGNLPSTQSRVNPTDQRNTTQICTTASGSNSEPLSGPALLATSFSGITASRISQTGTICAPEGADGSNIAQWTNSRHERIIGDIRISAAQVTELFKGFRTSYHRYLPFTLQTSSEVIYNKCPLLFWVICAVASSNRLKPRFAPYIRELIAGILVSPAGSVETVQALLIICMWPFSYPTIASDTSFFYSGLATQLGLQLGLHRPNLTHTHVGDSEQPGAEADTESRLTTWLACFVVSNMQSSYRGVPPSIRVDFSLQSSFNHPNVDPILSRMCHISRLHVQSSLAIGANAENMSGLLEASCRINMIKLFGAQYATLLRDYLHPMDDIIEGVFLSSRLQLWSFALLDDVPFTADLLEIYQQAEKDAVRLIQLGCERNLSSTPLRVSRSIIYSAMILIKILKSDYTIEHEAILHHVDRARQALSSEVVTENNLMQKAWRILGELPVLQDRKLTPQIYSRMTASIVYDSLRIHAEHLYYKLSMSQPANEIDFDGFDWNSLQL